MEELLSGLLAFENFSVAGSALEVVMGVALVAFGFINRKLTNGQIKADRTETAMEKKVLNTDKDVQDLSKSVTLLANMIAIAFLSSTSTDSEIKKKIAASAKQIEGLSKFEFETFTTDLIDRIIEHVPGEKLLAKKDEILKASREVDSFVDQASEDVGALVDKIGL